MRFVILGRSARGRLPAAVDPAPVDPDVAAVYPTAEAVDSALRALAEVARRQAGRAA